MSLRAELIGSTGTLPEFAVLLPQGWEAIDPEFDSIRTRLDDAFARLPLETRAALKPRLEEFLDEARAEALRGDVIRTFAPTAVDDEVAPPVTLVASWLKAPGASTVSGLGASMIERFGAQPFDPSGTTLKWSIAERREVDGGEVELAGAGYLLRVPHEPAVALLFRATILRGTGDDLVSDEGIAAMTLVCDAIVASVRWRRVG